MSYLSVKVLVFSDCTHIQRERERLTMWGPPWNPVWIFAGTVSKGPLTKRSWAIISRTMHSLRARSLSSWAVWPLGTHTPSPRAPISAPRAWPPSSRAWSPPHRAPISTPWAQPPSLGAWNPSAISGFFFGCLNHVMDTVNAFGEEWRLLGTDEKEFLIHCDLAAGFIFDLRNDILGEQGAHQWVPCRNPRRIFGGFFVCTQCGWTPLKLCLEEKRTYLGRGTWVMPLHVTVIPLHASTSTHSTDPNFGSGFQAWRVLLIIHSVLIDIRIICIS